MFTFLGFKISKSSNRFAGDVDTNVFRCSVGVAHEGCHAARVEDAIKITPCCLGSVCELIAGSVDLRAGVVRLLETFCSFVRLFQQHGVTLCPGGALSDEAEEHFARVDGGVTQPQLKTSARTAAFEATCGLAPP